MTNDNPHPPISMTDDLIARLEAWSRNDCPASRIMLDDRELRDDTTDAAAALREQQAEIARLCGETEARKVVAGEREREIARLNNECEHFANGSTSWQYKYADALERAERAEAERDALRQDAERYRWLRDQMTHERSGSRFGWTLSELYPGDDQDAAIDAAIAAAAESPAPPQP